MLTAEKAGEGGGFPISFWNIPKTFYLPTSWFYAISVRILFR
jgi:hypothetical protein